METDLLAKLIDAKHDVLGQLRELAGRQSELIPQSDMGRLLSLLAVKQRLLVELQSLERQLDPFRDQDPDQRLWRSPADRQHCREAADRCDSLLAEIMSMERKCESELIRRRDQASTLLQGIHIAASATQAYATALESRGNQLDVSCES